MTTNATNFPATKGVFLVERLWKTRVKVNYQNKMYVIWIPSDMANASVGDVYQFVKEKHVTKTNPDGRRLRCRRVDTTIKELIPIGEKTDVKLLNAKNGLSKIEINDVEHIVRTMDIKVLENRKIGEIYTLSKEEKNGVITFWEYTESFDDIFS